MLHEDSGEEHMEVGTADAETVANLGISDGVGAPTEDGLGMGVEIVASDVREDDEEFEAEASEASTREITVDLLATGIFLRPIEGTLLRVSRGFRDTGLLELTWELPP
ncbi:hypothetical protein Tco_0947120 [Tanacetum coccineum]